MRNFLCPVYKLHAIILHVTCQVVYDSYMIGTCLNETQFELDENFLCVDFANTLDWRESAEPKETLLSYEQLVAWAVGRKAITQAEAKNLLAKAKRDSASSEDALRDAISFRELLDEILSVTPNGGAPSPPLLKRFNEILHEPLGSLELFNIDGDFSLEVCCQPDLASPIIWPIVISAAQLLTSPEMARIGICQDEDGCGYFFHDTSKNHSKKYCGPNCATRAKVRRFREKKS